MNWSEIKEAYKVFLFLIAVFTTLGTMIFGMFYILFEVGILWFVLIGIPLFLSTPLIIIGFVKLSDKW